MSVRAGNDGPAWRTRSPVLPPGRVAAWAEDRGVACAATPCGVVPGRARAEARSPLRGHELRRACGPA